MVGALAPLRERFPETRWVEPSKLHLTLVFLGPTDPARVPSITLAMEGVAGAHQAFDLDAGESGGRATQWRGGVAWIRLERGAGDVARLALDLDAAIGSATYGDRHAPRPHLTVARGVSEDVLEALRAWSAARPRMSWQVDRIVLFRSHTEPHGSHYEDLASASLLTTSDRAT